jgi:tetratricopeptide (TPR) repeat protein
MSKYFFAFVLTGILAGWCGCPAHTDIKKDDKLDKQPDEKLPDQKSDDPKIDKPEEVEVVARPIFDPDKTPPCESHTACYLAAKEAHVSGKRAGYLLALDNCEYYRGRYQLEKFYGMCLLVLADSYRHLNNFEESVNCYQRFLDTQPDDKDMALQAREGIDEVGIGAKDPAFYRRYLEALAYLTRFNQEKDEKLAEKARQILSELHAEKPDWQLDEKVTFLIEQLSKLTPPEPELQPIKSEPEKDKPDEAAPVEDTPPVDSKPLGGDKS